MLQLLELHVVCKEVNSIEPPIQHFAQPFLWKMTAVIMYSVYLSGLYNVLNCHQLVYMQRGGVCEII